MATHAWKEFSSAYWDKEGAEARARAQARTDAYIEAYQLAERRKQLGLTQEQVAESIGITKSRVSQIERGEVSTVSAIARYVQAIGGRLQIAAVFGDDQVILTGNMSG